MTVIVFHRYVLWFYVLESTGTLRTEFYAHRTNTFTLWYVFTKNNTFCSIVFNLDSLVMFLGTL